MSPRHELEKHYWHCQHSRTGLIIPRIPHLDWQTSRPLVNTTPFTRHHTNYYRKATQATWGLECLVRGIWNIVRTEGFDLHVHWSSLSPQRQHWLLTDMTYRQQLWKKQHWVGNTSGHHTPAQSRPHIRGNRLFPSQRTTHSWQHHRYLWTSTKQGL